MKIKAEACTRRRRKELQSTVLKSATHFFGLQPWIFERWDSSNHDFLKRLDAALMDTVNHMYLSSGRTMLAEEPGLTMANFKFRIWKILCQDEQSGCEASYSSQRL
jgi:hypothetical protein